MVNHIFNTYDLKTELEVYMTGSCSIQTKCNELDTHISATRSADDTNKSAIGELWKEVNALKHKKWGPMVRVGVYLNK